jgi:L,D-peptidoglycan transpeptidase YkuD (ErfK/YbiS/YcfS/YnhG family)
VTTLIVDSAARTLTAFGDMFPCVIGRSGSVPAAAKREGDGATPLGRYPIRGLWLRPDRIATPVTRLRCRWIAPDDGWSDDPADPAYNQPVRHPHAFSAERLWRDDGLYDLILTIGHNDAPVVPGLGSAIFLHCASPEGKPTEGCVALARDVLVGLVERLAPGDFIEIV